MTAALTEGRRVSQLLERHEEQNSSSVLLLMQRAGAAKQPVGAEKRSEAGVQVLTTGLEVWRCLVHKQQGFEFVTSSYRQPAEGLKKVSDTGTIIPPALGYYIAVVAVNGTGNKHKQLTRAVLLAEHVTANYFRHCY